jgi:hypothetical protein
VTPAVAPATLVAWPTTVAAIATAHAVGTMGTAVTKRQLLVASLVPKTRSVSLPSTAATTAAIRSFPSASTSALTWSARSNSTAQARIPAGSLAGTSATTGMYGARTCAATTTNSWRFATATNPASPAAVSHYSPHVSSIRGSRMTRPQVPQRWELVPGFAASAPRVTLTT